MEPAASKGKNKPCMRVIKVNKYHTILVGKVDQISAFDGYSKVSWLPLKMVKMNSCNRPNF